MRQPLPTGGFRWVTGDFIACPERFDYGAEESKGLILEVDLEYPERLHYLHNGYPLAPKRIQVTEDMLSPYCKRIAEKYNIPSGRVHKLIPTLAKKEK